MRLIMIATIASLLGVTACQKQDAPEIVRADDVLPGGTSTPTVDVAAIASTNDLPRNILVDESYLKAEASFDEALFAKAPAIAMDIVEDAQIRIEAMGTDAQEYREADPDYFKPYALRIDWKVVAESGDVMSLEGFVYSYTAGAHGNHFTDARLYDSLTGQRMRLSEFFAEPQKAIEAHMPHVWQGVAEQKALKAGAKASQGAFLNEAEELISADRVLAAMVSLAPSTEDGKFGGYTVHFAPYEIGSYAEGSYHVTVPQSAFRDRLKPRFTNLFAGEPVEVERPGDAR